VTTREQRLVFGEVAEVRADYPADLVDFVIRYAGARPKHMVEAGAGTGLATKVFATLDAPITCIEPDPEMAAILAQKFAGNEMIDVVVGGFEDWTPPADGVDLLYCAQAWHWIDPLVRIRLAAEAVRPGGILALFGHDYNFADDMQSALDAVYAAVAPSLLDTAGVPARATAPRIYPEITGSPDWQDAETVRFARVIPYPTGDYLRLLTTFSPHRMLPHDRLAALLSGVAGTIDARGGVIRQRVDTTLFVARRTGVAAPVAY
jgi:SAM-dependent methyltransferase